MQAFAQLPAPADPKDPSAPRCLDLRYLDGLRACAALLVVLHHAWLTAWPDDNTAPFWTQWLASGHTVPVFMVMSGFCLMLPVVRGDGSLRGGAWAFLQKRARRILPPYYCAIGFALLLDLLFLGHSAGGFWSGTLPVTWSGLIQHLLLLQNFSVSQRHTINHVFWSLSLEWWIYLLFPGLIRVWKRLGPVLAAALSIGAMYALWRLCGVCLHQGYTLNYVGLFVLGMLAAEMACTSRPALRRWRERLPWGGMTWALAGLTLLAMTGRVRHFSSGDLVDLLAALGVMCLLVTLSIRQGTAAGRLLSQKPLVSCGTFAYSIYLVHAPLLQLIWNDALGPLHLPTAGAFLLLAVCGTPATLASSYLFHLTCERPFQTRLPAVPSPARSPRFAFRGACSLRRTF